MEAHFSQRKKKRTNEKLGIIIFASKNNEILSQDLVKTLTYLINLTQYII